MCVEYMCEHIADAAEQGQLVMWFQYVLSLNQPTTINVIIVLFYFNKYQGIYFTSAGKFKNFSFTIVINI